MRSGIVIAGLIALVGGGAYAVFGRGPGAEPAVVLDALDAELVALGERVYAENCASCHGAELEGQPDWRESLPGGGLPAPPHDESGHTWHHEDRVLFDYTKFGGQALIGPTFKSNMPAFKDVLDDHDIRAVLSFIKSTWPERVRDLHDQRNAAAQ